MLLIYPEVSIGGDMLGGPAQTVAQTCGNRAYGMSGLARALGAQHEQSNNYFKSTAALLSVGSSAEGGGGK